MPPKRRINDIEGAEYLLNGVEFERWGLPDSKKPRKITQPPSGYWISGLAQIWWDLPKDVRNMIFYIYGSLICHTKGHVHQHLPFFNHPAIGWGNLSSPAFGPDYGGRWGLSNYARQFCLRSHLYGLGAPQKGWWSCKGKPCKGKPLSTHRLIGIHDHSLYDFIREGVLTDFLLVGRPPLQAHGDGFGIISNIIVVYVFHLMCMEHKPSIEDVS